MENKRYIIINADDFGYNDESNKAICGLFTNGQITSTSLMAVAPCAEEAARLAREQRLATGIHFTFNSDDKQNLWHGVSNAESLHKSGGLYSDNIKLALNAKSSDITLEMNAQYDFMKNKGCYIDHADSHCGTLYGINGRMFFINAFRFCRDKNLPFRLPKYPDFLHRQFGGKAPLPLVKIYSGIIALGKRMNVKLIDDMITNPFSITKIDSYESLRDFYIDEIKKSRHRITEVFLHPSYPVGGVTDINSEWLKREYELRLLQSGDLLQLLDDLKIELVSWGDAPLDE